MNVFVFVLVNLRIQKGKKLKTSDCACERVRASVVIFFEKHFNLGIYGFVFQIVVTFLKFQVLFNFVSSVFNQSIRIVLSSY